MWADRAFKFIKKSKTKEALSLLQEYKELNEQEKKRASIQSYSVIKLNSQTIKGIKKYGDGFKSYD